MRTAAPLFAYAAALALGLSAAFGPTFESGFRRIQTERGDGMLNHYILEHTWRSVSDSDYHGSLFSPPCFYPEPYTLWYSEHLLGVAPLYWALRVVLPYDLAYQWWQIILAAANFVAMAAVLRWLRCSHLPAVLGAYLWAFALIQIDQIKHQQMIPRFAMALAAYHAWQLVLAVGSTPANPARHLNRMLAAVFVQAITCVNTAWFLVAGLGTFVPLALALRPGGYRDLAVFLRAQPVRVALILGGWGAALIAVNAPYMVINRGYGRLYEEMTGLIPTPSAWFTNLPGTPWHRFLAPFRVQVLDECYLFCGFGLYALMLAALVVLLTKVRRKERPPESGVMLAALLTAAIWVALTITDGHGGHSLWELVRYIPGGTAIRCVSRVFVLVYLFGLLGAVVWLSRVVETLGPPARYVVPGLVVAWCLVEQQGYRPPSFEKADFYGVADRVAAELKKGDIGYVVPRYTDTKGEVGEWVYGDVMGMWVGMRANVPVINGYSGRVPDEFHPNLHVAYDGEIRIWLQGKFRGRVAIVDPDNPAATRILVIE